jgi:WhiB family transcriptional regulator, redox-sensing transcriptional regulator
MINEDQTWASGAACAGIEPDALFVRGAAQRQARELCFTCPVRMECLAEALSSNTTFGVWGGLTERERRALVRRYPEGHDWVAWLQREDDELITELRAQRPPRIIARIRAASTA